MTLYERSGWYPRADVYRCADGWLVKVELAGVAEQDLRVEVQGDRLVIEGRRRDLCIAEAREYLSMEISYDWFRRSIRLPGPATAMRMQYRDGMLMIYLHDTE
ncbi:MAG: Hsp20/alpha crystallin family protein [Pseudomonadota bacterium]